MLEGIAQAEINDESFPTNLGQNNWKVMSPAYSSSIYYQNEDSKRENQKIIDNPQNFESFLSVHKLNNAAGSKKGKNKKLKNNFMSGGQKYKSPNAAIKQKSIFVLRPVSKQNKIYRDDRKLAPPPKLKELSQDIKPPRPPNHFQLKNKKAILIKRINY